MRVAIALACDRLVPSFPATQVEPFFMFLIQNEALGNRSSDVQREMLQAGVAVIDHHGAFQRAGLFFPTFETHFSGPSSANETGVVLLLGRAARHLATSDPRIPGTDGLVGLTCAARDAHGRGSELAVDRCAVQDTVRRTQVC